MSTIDQARQAWLADRMTALGASEIPSIFNEGYESAYELWARKSGLIGRGDESEQMEVGTLIQPVIVELLRRRTDMEIQEAPQSEFIRSESHPFIGCTPDARAFHESRSTPGVCEIKNVGHYFAKDWDNGTPLKVQIQTQTQMFVLGYDWAVAAALVGGNSLKYHFIERDDKFIAWMLPHVTEFWRRIQEGDAPPVDGSERTRRVLYQMHPNDNGEIVLLPQDVGDLSTQADLLSAEIATREKELERIRNVIREAIGPNTFGVLPDGSGWSNKTSTRKAYQVAESVSRTLRRTKAKGE